MRSWPSPLSTSTPVRSMPVTRAPIRSSTPSCSELRAPRDLRDRDRTTPAGSLPASSRITRTDVGSNERKSSRRLRSASSRTCPAISTPVGPAPTTDDREPLPALLGIGRRLGHLERAEDPPPELEGVVDRLHPGCEERELVVTEVGLAGAGGHDEAVVRHVERLAGTAGRVDDPALEVEARRPRRARRGRWPHRAARDAGPARSDPATGSRWRPGTAAAGTDGGSGGRAASRRPGPSRGTGTRGARRSRHPPRPPGGGSRSPRLPAPNDRVGARAGPAGSGGLVSCRDRLRRHQPGRGVDEREVGEGLREVPEVLARRRVDLLRVQVAAGPANESSFSNSARARSTSPIIESAETSQNEQMVNVPSASAGSPSSAWSTR